MSKAHYDRLSDKVLALSHLIPDHTKAINEMYAATGKTTEQAAARILWDVFHATKIMNEYSYQEFDYTDAHIKTAMKSIFKSFSV